MACLHTLPHIIRGVRSSCNETSTALRWRISSPRRHKVADGFRGVATGYAVHHTSGVAHHFVPWWATVSIDRGPCQPLSSRVPPEKAWVVACYSTLKGSARPSERSDEKSNITPGKFGLHPPKLRGNTPYFALQRPRHVPLCLPPWTHPFESPHRPVFLRQTRAEGGSMTF